MGSVEVSSVPNALDFRLCQDKMNSGLVLCVLFNTYVMIIINANILVVQRYDFFNNVQQCDCTQY